VGEEPPKAGRHPAQRKKRAPPDGGASSRSVGGVPPTRNAGGTARQGDARRRSRDLRRLLDAVDDPAVGALWDAGHTTRVSEEPPAETLDVLGEDVAYLHLKDAVHDPDHPDAMDDGWRYVLPGEGDLPLAAALAELRDRGYGGWVTFEHEKRWHPELESPADANRAFVEWFDGVV